MNTALLALSLTVCSTAVAGSRLLAQADAPRLEGSAREKLVAQLTLLEDSRPTLSAGKGLLIGGAAALAAGGLVFAGALALLDSANRTGDAFDSTLVAVGGMLVGVVGVVVLVAAGVLLISGLVTYLARLKQQSTRDEEINETRERLDALDRERAPLVRSAPLERRPLPGFVVTSF